jgi:hypothetical protein
MDNNFYKILETFKRIEESSAIGELQIKNKMGHVETTPGVGSHPDRLQARTGMNMAHKFPRLGQTNFGNIPGTNLPSGISPETKKYGEKRRADRPENLKTAIKHTLGKHGPHGILPEQDINLEEELMNEWNQYLKELGAPGVSSATSSSAATTNTGTGSTPAAMNPADVAKKKADVQKNLQGIPGIDANKAVANLTDKDDSGLDAALTKALTDPSTSQQAKQLLAKGMK